MRLDLLIDSFLSLYETEKNSDYLFRCVSCLKTKTNNLERVRLLMMEQGAYNDQVDSDGYTPLWRASSRGCLEEVQYFVQGATLDKASNQGNTPLAIAAAHGHLEV